MRTHGGGQPAGGGIRVCPVATASAKTYRAGSDRPGAMEGFRHFMEGSSAFKERAKVEGPQSEETLRRCMRGLARMMSTRPFAAADNPNIPSGYTYLLQFLTHDLVSSALPFWAAGGPGPGVENDRRTRLRLETLYGESPLVCPFAYAPDDPQDLSRTHFRLAHYMPRGAAAPAATSQPRDIARAETKGLTGARRGFSEPLIADTRNDQHAIIAQMTVLFALLHNAIADMLPGPKPGSGAVPLRDAHAQFNAARAATTLIYRHILRADLMERILHREVYAHYAVRRPDFLDRSTDRALPLEFSHGVFRFGHAMARDRYLFNDQAEHTLADALRQNSARSPSRMPLKDAWLLRWSHFFEMPDRTLPRPQASQLIGPHYSQQFLADDLFVPLAEGDPFGLAFRDLMSSGLARLWSVDDLARIIIERQSDLAQHSEMLGGSVSRTPGERLAHAKQERTRALTDWFGAQAGSSGLEGPDIAALADDPPLLFYVLLEAQKECGGERLGVLASVIVAEVIFGVLARDPLGWETDDGDLHAALGALCRDFFDESCSVAWTEFKFDTMADVVAFVAKRHGLKNVEPPFI